jgi:hypothetical protein
MDAGANMRPHPTMILKKDVPSSNPSEADSTTLGAGLLLNRSFFASFQISETANIAIKLNP